MIKNKILFGMGVASIFAYLFTALNSFNVINILPWQDAVTFIALGIALFFVAGGRAVFQVMNDGKITASETMAILTALVGLFSVIVGLPLIPIPFFLSMESATFAGIRGLVSVFALIFITIELWQEAMD